MSELRCPGRTDGPAIDAGGRNPNEQEPVEAWVAAFESSIAYLWFGHFHGGILSFGGSADSRFSDFIILATNGPPKTFVPLHCGTEST
jgi:hypothetical protein